jgi:alpha-mannosidase
MPRPQFIYVYESHLDLFWIGDYRYCLERGRHVIKQYVDRCVEHQDEAFLLETVVFLEHFLKEHPDYERTVVGLWREGRLDIGAAYVDILEHLVPGEGQIRNIVRGKRWCRERLGIDTRLAAHADLPSLEPQAPQIYARAGVDFYSTSRKVFPNGQVWVHVAPDGTAMRVFSHPVHYDFHELRRNAAALNAGRGWQSYLDPEEALKGFPLGKVVLSAGAADQADMEVFRNRHGRSAKEFVEAYRQEFPDYEFRFGTVSAMLAEYDGREEGLPRLSGEIPSVWGMTSVPSTFFQRGRRLEGQLLTVELLCCIGLRRGWPPVSEARGEWNGTLYERLYYLGKDPIPRGGELDELWKMHLFILDHNFSGNFASQTAFDKRTIQERALSYAEQMVAHGLSCATAPDAGALRAVLFNPLNWARTEPVRLRVPAGEGFRLVDAAGGPVPHQVMAEGEVAVVVSVPPVGIAHVTVEAGADAEAPAGSGVRIDTESICVVTPALEVAVDRSTGALCTWRDAATGANWGSEAVGRIYAMHEDAFDVPLGVDESRRLAEEEVHSVEVLDAGPLCARVRTVKSILNAHVEQTLTVWSPPVNAVDLETMLLWHGQRRVQLRQCLPAAARREDVFYGTPFYGSNWRAVVPGSGPRNPDEMANLEHWHDYRELQLYVHQRRPESALAMASLHPTYHWGRDGLEAVLMRTTPSGADPRFYWEHAGRREYAFRFRFTEADASLAAPARMGQEAMVPIAVYGPGEFRLAGPAAAPFVEIEGGDVILSAVHPDGAASAIVRFFEAGGAARAVTVRVAEAAALEKVNLLGEPAGERVDGAAMTLQVGAHEIVTLRARF